MKKFSAWVVFFVMSILLGILALVMGLSIILRLDEMVDKPFALFVGVFFEIVSVFWFFIAKSEYKK